MEFSIWSHKCRHHPACENCPTTAVELETTLSKWISESAKDSSVWIARMLINSYNSKFQLWTDGLPCKCVLLPSCSFAHMSETSTVILHLLTTACSPLFLSITIVRGVLPDIALSHYKTTTLHWEYKSQIDTLHRANRNTCKSVTILILHIGDLLLASATAGPAWGAPWPCQELGSSCECVFRLENLLIRNVWKFSDHFNLE